MTRTAETSKKSKRRSRYRCKWYDEVTGWCCYPQPSLPRENRIIHMTINCGMTKNCGYEEKT